jgi:signal transduction protein with GAF and PtsI domain
MFDDLLEAALKENAPKTFADKIIRQTEAEFINPLVKDSERERADEKEMLLVQLRELRRKLARTKNIRSMNPVIRQKNISIAEKRKKINEEIEKIKDRLFIISEERLGAKIDPDSLLSTHLNETERTERSDESVSGWKSSY